MTSRSAILKAVNAAAPVELPLPEMPAGLGQGSTESFLDVLHSIGGKGAVVSGWEPVQAYLDAQLDSGKDVVNAVPKLAPCTGAEWATRPIGELERVETVFLEGVLGVAENGSVWLPEARLPHRVLPFLCRHLVLVLHAADIVPDMHAAYARISLQREGYGVFIAGPSKTADIEQSLVIGAHGPLSLQVFLIS